MICLDRLERPECSNVRDEPGAVLTGVLFISAACRMLAQRAYRYLEHARETRNLLFQRFGGMTEGIKELKLHAGRALLARSSEM